MKTRALQLALAALALALAAFALPFACGPSSFAPATQIDSVRILASRADRDEAYAHPGDTVTLETLAVDGRAQKTSPMNLYWVPIACANPAGDAYYACFAGASDGGLPPDFSILGEVNAIGATAPPDAGGADAGGADAGEDAGSEDASVDAQAGTQDAGEAGAEDGGSTSLSAALPTFSFTVPANLPLTKPPGAPAPYGLIMVFNVACAGHLKLLGIDPSAGPQQVPLGCVDDAGNVLGPDDYVIGYTRVYVYDKLSNANPEVDGLVVNGIESRTGVSGTDLPSPVELRVPACGASCSALAIDVDVPSSSWEIDPTGTSPTGGALHESLWVDYFAMGGSLDSESRLLYDSQAGKITGTGSTVNYTPPATPGDATLFAVVHDNRDGITWLQVNVHAY